MPTVKIVAKDVSNGLAKQYHDDYPNLPFGYKLGLGVASLVNRPYVKSIPKFMPHSGLVLDDILYEYTEKGLFALHYDQKVQGEFPKCYSTFVVSNEQQKAFTQWIVEQSKEKFKNNAYDKVYNNCIVFTKDACGFFNAPFPKDLEDFLTWLNKEPLLVKMVGVRSESSQSASSSSGRPI